MIKKLSGYKTEIGDFMNKKSDTPLVSIVIPVYNGENYMREAIDSAINQTYSNIEIIVVNDGSTDNTEQIALEYGEKIRYFSKENGGVSSALNLGLKEMNGEYFQYLPHDDLILPDKIEKQINAVIASGKSEAIVWSDWEMYLQNENVVKRVDIPYEYGDISKITKGIYPLLFNFITIVTVLFPKKYLDMAGEFDISLFTSQDYDMMFRTFQGRDTIYINEPTVRYRWHDSQGTQADGLFIENCKDIAKKIQDNAADDEIDRIFTNRESFYYALLEHYQNLDWRELFIENYTKYKALSSLNSKEDVKNIFVQEFKKGIGKDSKIYLYCAGKNGRRLNRYLLQRDVDVAGFIDSNSQLIGTEIDGVSCVSLDKADKGMDIIIVTKDNPEDLEAKIRGWGYKNVTSFKKIGAEIFYTLPDKNKVTNYLSGGGRTQVL